MTKSSFLPLLTLTSVFLLVFAFTNIAYGACTNTLTSSTVVPTGFGASFNLFNTAKEHLISGVCETPSADLDITVGTITVGNGNSQTYTYNKGYHWNGTAWTQYTLSCSGQVISGVWCIGKGSASFPLTQDTTNVLGYNCQWNGSKWNCGCRDSACTASYWQLQRLLKSSTPPSPPPVGGGGGGSTVGSVGKSGLPWNSGSWINGGDDRMQQYTSFIGHEPDAVTQALAADANTWAELAGAVSDAVADQEFNRTPAQWVSTAPSFEGIFKGSAWMSHVWGGYPATEHRKRIIHLGWMDVIPKESGNKFSNGNYANPQVWRNIKDGNYDKYFFLLGRKFAYLDQKYGDTAYPMTFDFPYEWTLDTHSSSPEGSYMIGSTKYFTYQDFPYGWARMHRVFAEGYKYQRGKAMPYNFAWRPQLRFINSDQRGGGSIIRHETLWPNDIANWQVSAKVINGVTVLPAGPIGNTVHLVGASWHDSSFVDVKGSSATAVGNNWQSILNGNGSFWGLNEIVAFAKQKGVKMMFPEWGAHRPEYDDPSDYPSDFYRFTYNFFLTNKSNLAYETVFDQGDGNLYKPWVFNGQDAIATYKELWGR